MANTTNLNLSKLAGTEKLKTFPSMNNDNLDAIDGAFGADFGLSGKPSVNATINSLGDGLAILANGDTHAAITAGQFVYVRGHGSLSEGLYTATSNIAQNGTLSGSNLTADTNGGLNTVYSELNSKITNLHPTADLTSVSDIVTLIQKTDNYGYSLFRVSDALNAYLTGVNKFATVLAFKTYSSSNYIEFLSLDYDGDVRTGSYNTSTGTISTICQASIHIGSETGTTSSSGNLSKTFSKKVVVLSAWSSSGGCVITPYPSSGADDSGQYTWWFHVCSDAADNHVIANTSLTVYYTYMRLNG